MMQRSAMRAKFDRHGQFLRIRLALRNPGQRLPTLRCSKRSAAKQGRMRRTQDHLCKQETRPIIEPDGLVAAGAEG
jgi:hypothetical protein